MHLFEGKAAIVGLLAAAAVAAGVYFGSHGLRHFDPAVAGYALGTVLAAFAVGYRFAVWAQRPPSRMYFNRGLQLLLRRNSKLRINTARPPAPALELSKSFVTDFAAQRFIQHRGVYRWIMHLCLSGGCTLAFAITFPLVFGWVRFETAADNAEMYRPIAFGFVMDQFSIHSTKAAVIFNLLNCAAVIVLIGLAMAAIRRATDAGERATQKFGEDILPLVLIFAVTATGLMLTVSYKFLAGRGYPMMAVVHMVSVLALLFSIPFGKLFHLFQRVCSLCVSLYKRAGETGERAHCLRCGVDSGSQMQIDDLKIVLDQLGFNYRFTTAHGEIHYQDVCPACRRKLLALTQGRTVGR
jgi:hypothetical protein